MRLRTRGLVINFAYSVLIKCAESVTKINDANMETAMSMISTIRPQVYWTKRDTARLINEIMDKEDYDKRHRIFAWALKFFKECIKQVNRKYTRLVDCECIESIIKKEFGFSALDLYYIKKLLSDSGGLLRQI